MPGALDSRRLQRRSTLALGPHAFAPPFRATPYELADAVEETYADERERRKTRAGLLRYFAAHTTHAGGQKLTVRERWTDRGDDLSFLPLASSSSTAVSAPASMSDAQTQNSASLLLRNEQLNKAVMARPNDLNAWLEFLAFQDVLLASDEYWQQSPESASAAAGVSSSASATAARGSRRSNELPVAERKLSIVQRAIERNPGSLRLRLLDVELLVALPSDGCDGQRANADERWR